MERREIGNRIKKHNQQWERIVNDRKLPKLVKTIKMITWTSSKTAKKIKINSKIKQLLLL